MHRWEVRRRAGSFVWFVRNIRVCRAVEECMRRGQCFGLTVLLVGASASACAAWPANKSGLPLGRGVEWSLSGSYHDGGLHAEARLSGVNSPKNPSLDVRGNIAKRTCERTERMEANVRVPLDAAGPLATPR